MRLAVRFDAPWIVIGDPRLVVTLDDLELYEGSFASGFSVGADLRPGRYVLRTFIDGPMIALAQRFELDLDAEAGYRAVPRVEATLRYNSWTGAFARRLEIKAR